MFDYTKAALGKIIGDFKKIFNGIKIAMQLLSILYLFYAVFSDTGILIANIILLILALGYFIFFLVMETKKGMRNVKKRVKDVYGWSKRVIKLLTIGITVYGLVLAKTNFEPLSFLLVILMIFGWILEFLFYIIIKFLEVEIALLKDGLATDCERIPILGGYVKKATGKDSAEPQPPSKARLKLEKLVGEAREQKLREKQASKIAKKQQAIEAKKEKAQAKAELKAAKKTQKLLSTKENPEENE